MTAATRAISDANPQKHNQKIFPMVSINSLPSKGHGVTNTIIISYHKAYVNKKLRSESGVKVVELF
jgi:capsular polysaccharide biosynthesis protein